MTSAQKAFKYCETSNESKVQRFMITRGKKRFRDSL